MSELGLGSGQEGKQLDAVLCANAPTCCHAASKVCQNCKLVAYCCKDCQKHHWKLHKLQCKSPLMQPSWLPSFLREPRSPSFHEQNSYVCEISPEIARSQPFKGEWLWGNVPAYGLIGSSVLPAGSEADHLRLCFADSGDLRNVIETVCQIPDSFNGRASLYVNDSNPKVVVRNFLMLELLRVHGVQAIDAVISLWYSIALTSPQLKAVRALVRQVKSWTLAEDCTYRFCSSFGSSLPMPCLVAQFSKDVVATLLLLYNNDISLKAATEMRKSVMMSRPNLAQRRMCCLQPAHRVAWNHFMQTGLMLPFGSQALADNHVKANQFLFTPVLGWTLGDGPDPLNGWDTKQLKATGAAYGVPANDLYGCLFFHLRAKLQLFLAKWKLGKVRLVLTDMDASDLAEDFRRKKVTLHRVDTSNLADAHYMGIKKVLIDWALLLSPRPHHLMEPVLITYFLNWALVYNSVKKNEKIFADPAVTPTEMQVACRRGVNWGRLKEGFKELVMRMRVSRNTGWYMYFHDFTKAFDEYLSMNDAIAAAEMLGIVRKQRHSVVPHRLFVAIGASSNATPPLTMEDFEVHNFIDYNRTMTERFVEWTNTKSIYERFADL